MIINLHKHGQLCNRLFYTAHLYICAKVNGHTLVDFGLHEYMEYLESPTPYFFSFPALQAKVFRSWRVYKALLFFYHSLEKFASEIKYSPIRKINHSQLLEEMDAEKYLSHFSGSGIYFCEGWVPKEKLPLEKFREEIKTIIKPKKEFLVNVDKISADLYSRYELLVGIHLRRGDYREYRNGEYFFEDEEYKNFMTAFKANFPPEKKIVFVMCSNEKISADHFGETDCYIAQGNPIEDLYLLSRCNYIMGPPSTYSAWASYVGNKPLFVIDRSFNKPLPEHFKVCNDRHYAYFHLQNYY